MLQHRVLYRCIVGSVYFTAAWLPSATLRQCTRVLTRRLLGRVRLSRDRQASDASNASNRANCVRGAGVAVGMRLSGASGQDRTQPRDVPPAECWIIVCCTMLSKCSTAGMAGDRTVYCRQAYPRRPRRVGASQEIRVRSVHVSLACLASLTSSDFLPTDRWP